MLSEESITSATSDNSLTRKISYIVNSNVVVEFEGNWVKQGKVPFTHTNVVKVFFVSKWNTCSCDLKADFTLKIVYLELLGWLEMLILINIFILEMILDSIHVYFTFFNIKFWFWQKCWSMSRIRKNYLNSWRQGLARIGPIQGIDDTAITAFY